ncbi:MAG: alpha/beta hydrolase [Gemmatimonadota bacterium]
MATVFFAVRSLAPLAVGLALCTGPRAVNAQDLIEPEYETLLDEVNVSGDVFLGIMTGNPETEIRPDGSVMNMYVWIPEKLLTPKGDLCVRVQSIDGLYEAALRVPHTYLRNVPDNEKPGSAYHLAYRTQVDGFGVRHAKEVAIHAFWSPNCEAPGDSDPRLVAAWDRESADPNAVRLLYNNPEGRAVLVAGPEDEGQRCRSLEAVDPIAYDKVCEAVLTDSATRLEVHRWDGIEYQDTKTINLERPIAASAKPVETPSPPDSSPRAPPMVDKILRSVRLFYGTNRVRTESCLDRDSTRWDAKSACKPNTFYGNKPFDVEGGRSGLEVGTMRVSFPPDHMTGQIERPFARCDQLPQSTRLPCIIVNYRVPGSTRDEDPDKDVLIAELGSFTNDYEGWARAVRETGRNQAFVYVHGYATTFDEAARQAAQVAYDLDFDLEEFRGIPMVFSWPSAGEPDPDGYVADSEVSLEAMEAFNEFLDLVKIRAGVEFVHVIAHSMGSRVVANALTQAAARKRRSERFVDQLVLAAPDIFAARFKKRFRDSLPAVASRVTLYVSDRDKALIMSQRMHGGEPRAGQVAGGLLQESAGVNRFDAIDASGLETDFLGHSYYRNNDSMLSDIYCLLKGTPPQERPLLVLAGAGWSFRPLESVTAPSTSACSVLGPPDPDRRWWHWLLGGLGFLLFAIVVGRFVARRWAEA